jgi:dihydroflavonol-4-reductase
MITGATGYVAGELVKKLLKAGLTVHAPVRNPDDPEKLKYLNQLAQDTSGIIKYFKADLLEEGSYFESMKGCETVFHTASPFTSDVDDPQKELIDPALKGTRNVLNSVNKTDSVKRVVLTSSIAAVYSDNADIDDKPGHKLTEEDWNTKSSLSHNPYYYSKTLAEREAWKINRAQDRWDLVVINPGLVVGPGLNPNATSESYSLIKQMGDGTFKAGTPNWGLGVVDIRDVAEAHFNAAFMPEAKGRHIICGHNTSFPEMAKVLHDEFGEDYPIPTRVLPKALVWLVGPLANKNMTRKAISRNVGYSFNADNSKSLSALGITYTPFKKSMTDFFSQMVEHDKV